METELAEFYSKIAREKEAIETLKKENQAVQDKFRQLEEEYSALKERHFRELSSQNQQSETIQSKIKSETEGLKAEKSVLKMNVDMLTTKLENEIKSKKELEAQIK